MNLISITPVRNEAAFIGLTGRAVLRWCDQVVFLDHASTDATAAILEQIATEFPGRVHIMSESDPTWKEMAHRQALLEFARALGATHVAPVDADEILSGDLLPSIRDRIAALPPGRFMGSVMRNFHRSITQYRSDDSPIGSMAGTMLAFADHPGLGWRTTNGYDHHQRSPLGSHLGGMINPPAGGVIHLQFANWRRLLAKHALYKCMERTKYPHKRVREIESTYSLAPNENGLKLSHVPDAWMAPYSDVMKHLDIDAEPWQEAEVRRLVAEYGRDYFGGLDLFGVA